MEAGKPSPLGVLHFPSSIRLLKSGCCPDKDLVVLISRLGGRDRLSLWNYTHGSKVWETDVGIGEENAIADIAGLAWSPDGKTIAVVHNPPQVTLHSLQDGTKHLTLPILPSLDAENFHLDGVWWFLDERTAPANLIPDIFKRNEVVTGTAHAILRTLPLLDSLPEDSQRLTATDLFAFQGSQTKSELRPQLPSVICAWPTLAPSALGVPIIAPVLGQPSTDTAGELSDRSDEINMKSILTVSDDQGYLHSFLDGSFPLGAVSLGPDVSVNSLLKDSKRSVLTAQPALKVGQSRISVSPLQPLVVDLPLLGKRHTRDLAKLASTARELVWYIMRVIAEMHTTWFGSESFSGARELGPKWIQSIEIKQKEQFGQDEPNAILDLTTLLVTGTATDSLQDFLGSGGQMSERGIQKWESTMTEALVKLRDYAEKRIAPACQRLHLVLEELNGWSKMPKLASFKLSSTEISGCVELAGKMIVLTGWFVATVRQDISQFREFIHWLSFETSSLNQANDSAPQPRHDILEVNGYLMSGLLSSSIDQWFTGPIPQFSLRDLDLNGTLGDDSLFPILERARALSKDPKQLLARPSSKRSLDHLDKNIDALVNELAIRCKQVFERAAGAVSRSATILNQPASAASLASRVKLADPVTPFSVRERTVNLPEINEFRQYLALPVLFEHSYFLCITRLRYNNEALESAPEAGVVLLKPFVPVGDEETRDGLDLLEIDFIDDERIVIIYRVRGNIEPTTYIATACFNNLGYQSMQGDEHVNVLTREELILEAMNQWKQGHLSSIRLPIKQYHALIGCKVGNVSLALNGRQGRRVACVLDTKGTTLESFDLEGDIDDIDDIEA